MINQKINQKMETDFYTHSITFMWITKSVPLPLFTSSSPSSWAARMVTSCNPRESEFSILIASGMPIPLSETVRINRELLRARDPFSSQMISL